MLITENTKVSITLSLVVIILIFLIGGSFFVGRQWTILEARVAANEILAESHKEIEKKVNSNTAVLASQNVTLAEIRTDLKWIRYDMEKDNK